MGIHSPFGYIGYEVKFGRTIVELLKRFCSTCHTDEDFEEGCRGCPVGNLIYRARDYLLDAYESDRDVSKKETLVLRKIKKQLDGIEPRPLFDVQSIFDTRKPKDTTHSLEMNLEWLDHLRHCSDFSINSKNEDDPIEGIIKSVKELNLTDEDWEEIKKDRLRADANRNAFIKKIAGSKPKTKPFKREKEDRF